MVLYQLLCGHGLSQGAADRALHPMIRTRPLRVPPLFPPPLCAPAPPPPPRPRPTSTAPAQFFGVLVAWVLLRLVAWLAARHRLNAIKHSGYYGTPPQWRRWWAQLGVWVLIILVVKASLGGIIVLARTPLARAAEWLFGPFGGHSHAELAFVMVICPAIFNTLQFWVRPRARGDQRLRPGPTLRPPLPPPPSS